ncbi:nucleoside-diphosphate-sugar epimerase [Aliiruegeria haliotis]|uniref:Nucleoside-diphosphate-sugar epimerase n=1 Tax=Aliiruegeria haliotis TaxID=1280846 RepID=A0A2T0RTE8_9RHOB|nr:SDR family oxidoreductase [Aliiruegeria haliotis]PRY24441.1 nucleoside-diphosphate-sugar epimerase [Aliiruegeria haliotis]
MTSSEIETILVTGAGGYIGTTLVPMLLEQGYKVRALDRFFFGRELLADHANLDVIVEDSRHLTPAHLDNVDAVIDLVALSNDPSGELFQDATYQINRDSRIRCARLAKAAGAKRYILPSSCSIYGFQDPGVVVPETAPTNPLTTYAKANEMAELGVLPLADDDFCVIVLRQATVYGLSPRMRFDLAINGMSEGAWKTGKLPLMRDGSQWRPMVHVTDTARAQIFMLTAPRDKVSGQIFNVGSDQNNYQLGPLAEIVAHAVPRDVEIEWYGDPDHRSYRVAFDKIEALGWTATKTAADGTAEICAALEAGTTAKTTRTITLAWYQELMKWHSLLRGMEMHGGLVDLGS